MLAADELVNDALSEALATALGGAWFVAQIAGDVPARAWYDNEAVDALARRIYPKVSSGIGRGEPLDLLLPGLIADCRQLLDGDSRFLFLTVYAVRMSALAIGELLRQTFADLGGTVEAGELAVREEARGLALPTAIWARWRA